MSVYLSTQKVIKDWIDYNDHMNVSYYLLMFDKYGADTLNNIFKMGEHSAKTTKKACTIVGCLLSTPGRNKWTRRRQVSTVDDTP